MTLASATLRDLVAAVLVVAAGSKAADPKGFARTLAGLGLHRVPSSVRTYVAGAVIAIEGALGLLTVAQVTVVTVNWVNLILVFCFAIVSTTAMLRGVLVHCRCFGALSGTSFSRAGVARSWMLVVIAAVIAAIGDPQLGMGPQTAAAVVAFLLVGIAAGQASAAIETLRMRSA